MRKLFLALALVVALPALARAATQTATAVLTWQNGAVLADGSNAPTGVSIERKTGTGTYAEIVKVGVVTTATDVIAADPGSTQYCYRLREFNALGFSGYSNEACVTTPVIPTTPPTPGSLVINLTVK